MENVYVGLRYVPKFSGDWDNTKTYEPLEIVTYQGNSYTSKTYVPTGASISNTDYWAPTGNYNAQVETYRQETARVQNDLDKKPFIGRGVTLPATASDYGNIIGVDNYSARMGDLFVHGSTKKMYYISAVNAQYELTWAEIAKKDYVDNQIAYLDADISQDLSNLRTTIENETKFLTKTGLKIGFFGDSWVLGNDNYGGHYTDNFAKLVGDKIGGTSYNYGLGGAGFCRKINGKTLGDHLDDVHADTDTPDLDICVVMGGFNDWNHLSDPGETYTAQDINAAAQLYLTKLISYFPNSKIIWCGMNMKCCFLDSNFWAIHDYLENVPTVVNSARPVLKCTNWLWSLIGKSQYYNNDKVHPNPQGHINISNCIVNALYGGQNDYSLLINQNNSTGVFTGATNVSGQFYVQQKNSDIIIHFPVIKFSADQTGVTIQSSITVSEIARPFSTQVVQAYTGSTSFECVCVILETGVMYLKRVDGSVIPADTNIYIPEIRFNIYSNQNP